MTIKKALNRIHWRITSKSWKANKEDAEAFNAISDFVEQKNKLQLENNEVFAKMYIYLYGQLLRYYNATVFDKTPKKAIFEVMEKPMSQLIEEFTRELNDSERYQYLDELGVENKHPLLKTEQQKKEELKNVDVDRLVKDVWDIETVTDNLNRDVNNLLNYYKS